MPRGGKRKGAGRKADGDAPKQRISMSLPADLVKWLKQQSENRSEFVEKILRREKDGGTGES
jgi:hypothetical protein